MSIGTLAVLLTLCRFAMLLHGIHAIQDTKALQNCLEHPVVQRGYASSQKSRAPIRVYFLVLASGRDSRVPSLHLFSFRSCCPGAVSTSTHTAKTLLTCAGPAFTTERFRFAMQKANQGLQPQITSKFEQSLHKGLVSAHQFQMSKHFISSHIHLFFDTRCFLFPPSTSAGTPRSATGCSQEPQQLSLRP